MERLTDPTENRGQSTLLALDPSTRLLEAMARLGGREVSASALWEAWLGSAEHWSLPDEVDRFVWEARLGRAVRDLGLRLERSRQPLSAWKRSTTPVLLLHPLRTPAPWVRVDPADRTDVDAWAGSLGLQPSDLVDVVSVSVIEGSVASTSAATGRTSSSAVADDHAAHHHHGPSPRARLWSLLRTERSDVWTVVSYSVVVGFLSLGVPVAVQSLVNTLGFGTVLQPVVWLTLAVFVALLFAGILRVLQAQVVEWMQQRLFVRTAVELGHRLVRARVDALTGGGPELVNRFFDVLTIQKSAAILLLDGLAVVLQTGIGMALLAFYHPLLLAFDAVLALALGWVVWGMSRGATETAIEESKAKYAVAAALEDITRHPLAFKADGAGSFALRRIESLLHGYVDGRSRHFRILRGQLVGSVVLQAAGSALLLGLGGWLVVQRQLSLGQLVAAELVVSSVLLGISKFGKHLETYYDLLAAVDKLGHLLDLPQESRSGGRLPLSVRPPRIALRGVSITPDGGAVDADWAPGARVAVLGPSGAGKSRLLSILYRAQDPVDGTVLWDGDDARTLTAESWRQQAALVPSLPEPIPGTVFENVRLGRASVGRDRVREVLTLLGVWNDVLALPRGWDTALAADGAPLSLGQLRIVMLARALVGRPRLLLLDGALDALPASGRSSVISAVLADDAPWTVLCVTDDDEVRRRCTDAITVAPASAAERGLS